MDYQISSITNEKIKLVSKLKNAKDRKKTGLFVVEGEKEINEALKNKFVLEELYYCPDYSNTLITDKSVTVSASVMEKISYREIASGVLAVFRNQEIDLKDIKLKDKPLIIILENIEKPGNLGAIARTAKAAGVDIIIAADYLGDIYNPNSIRSSRGYIFSLPIIKGPSLEIIKWLKDNKITSYGAVVAGGEDYWHSNLKESCAIVLGTEDVGLSELWLNALDKRITIDMKNEVDSLNVSVSAALLAYEAGRQRSL